MSCDNCGKPLFPRRGQALCDLCERGIRSFGPGLVTFFKGPSIERYKGQWFIIHTDDAPEGPFSTPEEAEAAR